LVTTTKIGQGIPRVVSLFSDVRTILEDADNHDLRVNGQASDFDLEYFADLDEDEVEDVKKR
jgi:hypothetical protein